MSGPFRTAGHISGGRRRRILAAAGVVRYKALAGDQDVANVGQETQAERCLQVRVRVFSAQQYGRLAGP